MEPDDPLAERMHRHNVTVLWGRNRFSCVGWSIDRSAADPQWRFEWRCHVCERDFYRPALHTPLMCAIHASGIRGPRHLMEG